MFTNTRSLMNAREAIISAYDKDDLKEIASHGCGSGVCHEHIYYGDTIKFFDTYEDELLKYFTDKYDTEFLIDLFKDADADLTIYKNTVVWAYIESIAFQYEDEALLQPV